MVTYPQGDNTAARNVDLSELTSFVNASNQASFCVQGLQQSMGKREEISCR